MEVSSTLLVRSFESVCHLGADEFKAASADFTQGGLITADGWRWGMSVFVGAGGTG